MDPDTAREREKAARRAYYEAIKCVPPEWRHPPFDRAPDLMRLYENYMDAIQARREAEDG